MKKLAIMMFLSAFVATPALADDTGTYYIGADFGVAKCCNLTNYSGSPGWSNPAVFSLSGGYHFSPALAVEMGYSTFGDSNGTVSGGVPATLSLSSFYVTFVGSLPVGEQFDLLGRIGLASNNEQYSDVGGYYGKYSQSDLTYGLGAQIHVSRQVSLRVMYDSYGKFDNFDPPVKATSFSMGMVYNLY